MDDHHMQNSFSIKIIISYRLKCESVHHNGVTIDFTLDFTRSTTVVVDIHVQTITRRPTDVMWVDRSDELLRTSLIEKSIQPIQNLSNGFRETQPVIKST